MKDSKAAAEKQFFWTTLSEGLIKVGHAVISKYYASYFPNYPTSLVSHAQVCMECDQIN